MAICLNAQMCSYVRTLFEYPSKWYEAYQENGTKYLKSRKKLDDTLQQQLNACAGEIFLCGIPADTTAEKIAEVASLLGEVYILRYKVHFSGASRGFAYLQYIDPSQMPSALEKLPLLFRALQLPMIKVCISRNSSKLLLRKTFNMTPYMVFETLTKLTSFNKLVGRELTPGNFEYQIIFRCNEEAVHARREILKSIVKFGHKAVVVWDTSSRTNNLERPLVSRASFNRNINYALNQMQNEMTSTLNTSKANLARTQNISANTFLQDFNNLKLF